LLVGVDEKAGMTMVVTAFNGPATWLIVVVALLVFGWNAYNRAQWDVDWNGPGSLRPKHPEGRWCYDNRDLEEFARAAADVPGDALEFYRQSILRRSDLCFAIALAGLTAWIWGCIAITPQSHIWLNWIALPGAAMAIVYGIADVAEDLKLASIFDSADKVDRAEAMAANMLTRIKMVALCLSLIGLIIFWVCNFGQTMLAKALAAKRKPAAA
jgi:hypothetical protein